MTRTFDDKPATREKVPLVIGLMGPSGGGKTFSALRLATGIQKVTGGEIFMIDTEAKRSLHYADKFKFRFIEFTAPFCPLDYLAAIEHAVKRGATTVIVDSMSHEHEGPGGVLEQHQKECERLSKAWNQPVSKVQLTAWADPKAKRRRLINTVTQLGVSAIFCFRAKEKIRPDKSEKSGMVELGWMPIAGEEFVYEMGTNLLLPPGANGVPIVVSDMPGEHKLLKVPGQFRSFIDGKSALTEATGEALARWAAGDAPTATKQTAPAATAKPRGDIEDALVRLTNAPPDEFESIAVELRDYLWTTDEGKRIKATLERLRAAQPDPDLDGRAG